jgi:O-antigen/teichoic acid export membrane protein
MTAPSRGGGRRLTAITLDQAVSSSSNIIITVLAARVLGAVTFGYFGVVYLTYVTTQGVLRALLGEPLLVRPDESRDRPGEAIGTAAVLGFGVGIVIATAGAVTAVWSHDLGLALVVLGACLPLMVLQDLGRYLSFATQRPSRALALDLVWLGLLVVAVGALAVADAATLSWFIVAWAGSGATAGALLLWQHRHAHIRPGIAWLRETWPFSWRYAVSFGSRQGAVLLASTGLAAILGARALGAVNGALLLYGPLVQFQTASIAFGVTEVSRLEPGSPAVKRHVRRFTALTTGVATLNLATAVLLPDRLGEMVLGDTWRSAETVLAPAGVQMLFIGMTSGVRATLLGMRAVATTLRADIAQTAITFASTLLGALMWRDVVGAFWTMAFGQGVMALTWWAVYRAHERRREEGSVPTPTAP